MPIGDALTFDYPTTAETYAVALGKLKAILQTIEGILEQDIDTGSLDLTEALSLGGSYIYNLIRIVLSQVATPPTDNGSLYVDDDGELHIVTPNGDIKITLNGQINITSTGAIVGDYGAADEAVYYDQVSGEYRFFKDTSPEAWATLIAKAFKAVHDAGAPGSALFGLDSSVTTDLVFKLKSLPASGVGGLAYQASSGAVVDASVERETLEHLFGSINLTGDITLATGKIKFEERKYLTYHFDLKDFIDGGTVSQTLGPPASGLLFTNGLADTYLGLPEIPSELQVTKVEAICDGNDNGTVTLVAADASDGTYTNVTGAVDIARVGSLYTLVPTTPIADQVLRLQCTPPNAGTPMRLVGVNIYVKSE